MSDRVVLFSRNTHESAHWSTCRYLPGTISGDYTVRGLFTVSRGHRGQGFDDRPLLYSHTNLLVGRGLPRWGQGDPDKDTYGPEDEDPRHTLSPSLDVSSVFWSITGATLEERRAFARTSAWAWRFNTYKHDGAPLDYIDGDGDRKQRRGVYRALKRPDATIGALHYSPKGRIVIPSGRWFAIELVTNEPLALSAPLEVRFMLHAISRSAVPVG